MSETEFTGTAKKASFRIYRRLLLGSLVLSGISALTAHKSYAAAPKRSNTGVIQPETADDESFMERAFLMRQLAIDYGDQAYGAILVRKGKIIGQSWSRVVLDSDPTAHAEMSAIRDAAFRVNDRKLSGTVLYSSSKPCPMCEAAAYWCGIEEMIHGRNLNRAGSPQLCR